MTWLESRTVQNAVLTSAKVSLIATDEQGMIQLFNAGAEHMLGYASAHVVNQAHLADLSIAPGFETLIRKASRGIEDSYELTYRCKDGSRLPAAVSVSALRDDSGVIIGYLWIGADESIRKQAKADLLSGMSHELRTPLNAILGFAQLMAAASPSPTTFQQRSIDLILQAGWHQLELINEMLDLALIEAGKLALVLEPVSLAELLPACMVMTKPQAQVRGVSLNLLTGETPCLVKADRMRLQQVLVSLLSHAIKHSDAGAAVVVDHAARGPDCARVFIRGAGGMSADRPATTGPGNGVGLVLTNRLVELMGGTVGVDNDDGTGCVLWFELNRMAHPASASTNTG